jgi:long-chain acyl-CoA synthetase
MQVLTVKPYFKVRPFSDLREMLRQSVSLYGNLPAFRFREDPKSDIIRRTYREFGADVDAFGTALLSIGLADKNIAIIGENSYRWAVSHVSVVNGVGLSVPLDRLLPSEEILALLQRGRVSAVIFDGSFHETMVKAHKLMPEITSFICMKEPKGQDDHPEKTFKGATYYGFESLLTIGRKALEQGDTGFADRPIDPEQIASLLFTSGTTSQSKGVLLRNRNITADIIALAKVEKFPVGTRMLSILPLHHTFENTCGLFYALYFGGCVCICDGLRYIQKNMEEYKINLIIGVPTLFESFYKKVMDSLIKQNKLETVQKMIKITRALRKVKIDLRRVIFKRIHKAFGGSFVFGICGAAPIDPQIITFFDDIGLHIMQGYGLTETSPVIAGCNYKVFVPGTVGLPLGDITIAIDNAKDGDEGEILVKGPVVMAGYYEDKDATAAAIDADGWFHTGDVGRIDSKSGCILITGRLKSMIVLKSGKKVFPEEIEQLIMRYPFIKDSMVFGENETDGDVTISAKFVLDPQILSNEGITEEELVRRLDQVVKEINLQMPTFKGIRYYVYSFQDLIKTTTLKVKRPNEIRQMQERMDRAKVKLRQWTGKNIDLLDSSYPVTPLEDVVGKKSEIKANGQDKPKTKKS